jgi:protein ImuB
VPERFDEQHELPVETAVLSGVQPVLERLLANLGVFLRVRAAGVAGLRLDLLHRHRAPTRIRIGLVRPAGDAAHLSGLVAERLARERLPAPVIALRLRTGVLLPLALRDARLFERGQSADPEATARLLDRLRARLGQDAVFGVCPVPEHRPERAWRIAEPGGTTPLPGQWPVTRPERPLWMLVEPQPFDGWEGTLVTGPERIETGWWDGHDIRRDYYVALTRSGVRLWLFRERPPGRGWFLHGVFG